MDKENELLDLGTATVDTRGNSGIFVEEVLTMTLQGGLTED